MNSFEIEEPTTFQPTEALSGINTLLEGLFNETPVEKYIFSLGEIMSMEIPKQRTLWGDLLPLSGLAAIVGPPDSGKSMFCRELVLRIATGESEFAGHMLQTKHRRAIYVSTEDGLDANMFCFHRQVSSLSVLPSTLRENENLKVIFTDQIDSDTLLVQLTSMLTENPVDVIVLDSYSDLFTGKDSNSNSETRKFLRAFNRLANQFNCLVLFIHHINKSGYNDSPNQRHVQGASALGQKLRLIIELRPKEYGSNLRYLTVTKGNWISGVRKKTAIEYEFSEENFSFTATGNERPLSDFLSSKTEKQPKEEIDYSTVFETNEESLKYNDLCSRIQSRFHCAVATAKRIIRDYFVKGEDRLYHNPKYQSIIVSNPTEKDTLIPDTNEAIYKYMQDGFEFEEQRTL
jgi:archaellum biogenesis ATPase FlaH